MTPKRKKIITAAALLILAIPLSAWAGPKPSRPARRTPPSRYHQRYCPPPRASGRYRPSPTVYLRSPPAPVYYYSPPSPVYYCPPPPPPSATIMYRGRPWSFMFTF